MSDPPLANPAPAPTQSGERDGLPDLFALPSRATLTSWPDYAIDAAQRGIFFTIDPADTGDDEVARATDTGF